MGKQAPRTWNGRLNIHVYLAVFGRRSQILAQAGDKVKEN
jgi:hypothetical protein